MEIQGLKASCTPIDCVRLKNLKSDLTCNGLIVYSEIHLFFLTHHGGPAYTSIIQQFNFWPNYNYR